MTQPDPTGTDPNDPCVFCHPELLDNAAYRITGVPITIYRTTPRYPVTPGHHLYFPLVHVASATTEPAVTAWTVQAAIEDARRSYDHFNIITSIGRAATQSVMHLHVHVVPRGPHEDRLCLPWDCRTDQQPYALVKEPEAPRFTNESVGRSSDHDTCGECGGLKCPLDCDRPWDQAESRLCPTCQKHKPTCANDHCMECGSST